MLLFAGTTFIYSFKYSILNYIVKILKQSSKSAGNIFINVKNRTSETLRNKTVSVSQGRFVGGISQYLSKIGHQEQYNNNYNNNNKNNNNRLTFKSLVYIISMLLLTIVFIYDEYLTFAINNITYTECVSKTIVKDVFTNNKIIITHFKKDLLNDLDYCWNLHPFWALEFFVHIIELIFSVSLIEHANHVDCLICMIKNTWNNITYDDFMNNPTVRSRPQLNLNFVLYIYYMLYMSYRLYLEVKNSNKKKETYAYFFVVFTSFLENIVSKVLAYIKSKLTFWSVSKKFWKYRSMLSYLNILKVLFYFLMDFLKLIPLQANLIILILIKQVWIYISSFVIIKKIIALLKLILPKFILINSWIFVQIITEYTNLSLIAGDFSTSILINVFYFFFTSF